jgi:hypothetical protein
MLHHDHLSDETLLGAIDDELQSAQERVAAHLIACEDCRARMVRARQAAEDWSSLHRDLVASAAAGPGLRARLQIAMAETAEALDRSLWFRVRHALAATPRFVRVAGCVLGLTILAVQLARTIQGQPASRVAATAVDAGALPLRSLTPGAAGTVGMDALCGGRATAREPIPSSVRQVVLRQYRMEHVAEDEYELDYLITPELGGIPDPRNLWPERYSSGVWNARVKDDLERLLPRLVCEGAVDLPTAQRDIARDWIAAYKKYFKTDRPITRETEVIDDGDDDEASMGSMRSVGHARVS